MIHKDVTLIEVGPRDGLQAEKAMVSVDAKIELIERLRKAGLSRIEVGSFVSPHAIPQMANTDQVVAGLAALADGHAKAEPARHMALVPNMRGLEDALRSGLREIAVFTAASESFTQRNIKCSMTESLNRFAPVFEKAKAQGLFVRAYVSCVMGCPYEGEIPLKSVVDVVSQLQKMGAHEISLGDTIGVGTPRKMAALVREIAQIVPTSQIAVHCHDTYGQALVNIYAALEEGVQMVDSSVAGLGGCPYAQGSSGNVATEDVVYMLEGMGLRCGVNFDALVAIAAFIERELHLPIRSRVSQARLSLTDQKNCAKLDR